MFTKAPVPPRLRTAKLLGPAAPRSLISELVAQEQAGGGGVPELTVDGEKSMFMVEEVGSFGLPADSVAVPENVKVPTSAGNEPALVLEMMLQAKQQGLPLPGAIAPGTPMADVTKTGDTFYTNEMVDNVLVSRDGFCDAGTRVYAHG